jgi:hypothetical protein
VITPLCDISGVDVCFPVLSGRKAIAQSSAFSVSTDAHFHQRAEVGEFEEGGQELQGNLLVQPQIVRAVDFAHATAAQYRHDATSVREDGARREGHEVRPTRRRRRQTRFGRARIHDPSLSRSEVDLDVRPVRLASEGRTGRSADCSASSTMTRTGQSER